MGLTNRSLVGWGFGGCTKEEGEESKMSVRFWPEQLEEQSYHLLRLTEMQKFADL